MTDRYSLDATVSAYYEQGLERSRLDSESRLELVRTQELLARHLPPPPATVLDVGGAAGAHALPLLARGYDVALVDPVALHVDQARAAGVTSARIGDARHLDAPDDSVDVVLLLGPLYHLPDREDRLQALREARRVAGPTGLVVAAVISRFASTFDGLHRGYLTEPAFEQIVESDVASGLHHNPEGQPDWFTTAFFHDPAVVAEEVRAAGSQVDHVLAVEGVGSQLSNIDEWLDDADRRATLLRAISRVEAEPSLLGASPHLLVVSSHALDGS